MRYLGGGWIRVPVLERVMIVRGGSVTLRKGSWDSTGSSVLVLSVPGQLAWASWRWNQLQRRVPEGVLQWRIQKNEMGGSQSTQQGVWGGAAPQMLKCIFFFTWLSLQFWQLGSFVISGLATLVSKFYSHKYIPGLVFFWKKLVIGADSAVDFLLLMMIASCFS